MKRLCCLMLCALLCLSLLPGALAEVTAQGLQYRLDEQHQAHLTSYTGGASELVLPEQLDGHPLVGIDRQAFSSASQLRRLTLPRSLQGMQGNPMKGLDIQILLPEGQQHFALYRGALYNSDLTHLYAHPYGGKDSAFIAAPTLQSIGDHALYGCAAIRDAWLPQGVRSIGEQAFADCRNLLYLGRPFGPVQFPSSAFEGCMNLRFSWRESGASYAEVYLPMVHRPRPDSIFSGDYEYTLLDTGEARIEAYLGKAKAVRVPSHLDGFPVVMINEYWLYGHEGVELISLPDTLKVLERGALARNPALKEVDFEGELPVLHHSVLSHNPALTRVATPKGLQLIDASFQHCTALDYLFVPPSVAYIHPDAFQGCDQLSLAGNEGAYAQRYAATAGLPYQSFGSTAAVAPAAVQQEAAPVDTLSLLKWQLDQASSGEASDKQLKELAAVVDSTDEEIRSLYLRTLRLYQPGQLDRAKTAMYSWNGSEDAAPNTINLNLKEDAADGSDPYRTFFHESGHAIDFNLGRREQGAPFVNLFRNTTNNYDDVALEEAARFDVSFNLRETVKRFAYDEKQAERVFILLWSKYDEKASVLNDLNVALQVKAYYNILFQGDGATVSDIYGGVTNNRLHLNTGEIISLDLLGAILRGLDLVYGAEELELTDWFVPTAYHDAKLPREEGDDKDTTKGYWYTIKKVGEGYSYSRTNLLGTELFASYFSARMRRDEGELQRIRTMLPDATELLELIVTQMHQEADARQLPRP